MQDPENQSYWSAPVPTVLQRLKASPNGLSSDEAARRLKQYGENTIKEHEKTAAFMLFISQFKNPIILILLAATLISALTGDLSDSLIILAIIMGSAVLSFFQEYSAGNAVEDLRAKVHIQSIVQRDGKPVRMPSSQVVPGDVVLLSAGSIIPADGIILECQSFFVNQSILTGESFPVEKKTTPVSEDAGLVERENCAFMGTNVRSGSASLLVVSTGRKTEFGQVADKLTLRPPETEFERGVRHFGYMLTEMMLILTLAIFAINVIFNKPAIDSLLFSVSLAVGITPQLLPAIINIALARGSRMMAKEDVIVRHLSAIENFGSMDILCTDKTGTLTEGVIHLDRALDVDGRESDLVFRLAYLNASLQTGLVNSLDEAITKYRQLDISSVQKIGEVPYDFSRKRLSVVARDGNQCSLIVKGALASILEVCTRIQNGTETAALDAGALDKIQQHFANWSNQGFRVLGIAQKSLCDQENLTIENEHELIFMGFLLFFDPPKTDVIQTIGALAAHGVQLRIITGDNKLVALHVAQTVGLDVRGVLTGSEIRKMNDEAFWSLVENTTIFAEVDPNQKERIILAFKKKNHVVGYMGDGINDVPALHAADVSISVNTAVDVAKESADFVLLDNSLDALKRGIELGRITFANTLKYIFITTSANFGNMFSMAGASIFMPFLPLLPKQILLINFITDFPAMTISNDSVDADMVKIPRRWDIRFIRRFMFTFGLISSAFDYLTFAVLLLGFRTTQESFQSGWFVLSILTELLVLLVMRTRKPFYKSKPAPLLLFSTIGVGLVTLVLPYIPFVGGLLNINPIPLPEIVALLGIAALYVLATEIGKRIFYRKEPTVG